MRQTAIFAPMFVMVLLTFIVWLKMYFSRVNEMKAKQIHPQKVAQDKDLRELLVDSAAAANNFRNLFEIPVLFYAACLTAHVLILVDPLLVAMAWTFVILRIAHSFIQITYNRVMHRFYAYLMSSTMMWAMWILIAWRMYIGWPA